MLNVMRCSRRLAASSLTLWALNLVTLMPAAETVPLSSLDLSKMSAGWGKPMANRSVQDKPLSIAGRVFKQGVGTHAESYFWINLQGGCQRFTAWVGVDDEVGSSPASIEFRAVADGETLFRSGILQAQDAAQRVELDLTGKQTLGLIVRGGRDGISFDHANWADAVFEVTGAKPQAIDAPPLPDEPKLILTPKPGPQPQINGPRLFGARPDRPFVYRIPCTGTRPITFSAEGLPAGLTVDPTTGILSGTTPKAAGNYAVTLRATNSTGIGTKAFTLAVGDTLALTPPMGWNSWYIHYFRVTEQHMRAAADTMIQSGMADYGYMYVNIDDCWMKKEGDEPYRDAVGAVLPNEKFPDIRGMVDAIHARGLRAGTYISPGPWTCAGYMGSYQHEQADAQKFAEWGFDFLKYDWCSYESVATGEGREKLMKPYQQMGDILKTLDRDLVLNLCQYGMGNVWEWGGAVGGHCWRTTGDLGLERDQRLPGFYSIGLSNAKHWEYAKPGQWNDPDYILIGWVGSAHAQTEGTPTGLTANEQYSYMAMWSLMAAPLIFSGDMAKLDDFTLNVLCNAEVIAIDQDALGKQARIVEQDDDTLVLAKPLEDGSLAVGLFNLDDVSQTMGTSWSALQLQGPHRVRDVWRQVDIGTLDESFEAVVPRHGVTLIRCWPNPGS
ncbi:MAG: NPCBM/NEW2 domain-containing protein [Pirellulaceae bacterium]